MKQLLQEFLYELSQLKLDTSQKVGTVTGSMFGMIQNTIWGTVTSAAVGAVVGFVVTAILRYVWEWLKRKYNFK